MDGKAVNDDTSLVPDPVLEVRESTEIVKGSPVRASYVLPTDPLSDRKARVLQSFVRSYLENQHKMEEHTREEAVLVLQKVVRSLLLSAKQKGGNSPSQREIAGGDEKRQKPKNDVMGPGVTSSLKPQELFKKGNPELPIVETVDSDDSEGCEFDPFSPVMNAPEKASLKQPPSEETTSFVVENPFEPYVEDSELKTGPSFRTEAVADQQPEELGIKMTYSYDSSVVTLENSSSLTETVTDESKAWELASESKPESLKALPESTVLSLQTSFRRRLAQSEWSRKKSAALKIQTALRSSSLMGETAEDTPKAVSPLGTGEPGIANKLLDATSLEGVPSDESITSWTHDESVTKVSGVKDSSGTQTNSASLKLVHVLIIVLAMTIGLLYSNPPACSPIPLGPIEEGLFDSPWWAPDALKDTAGKVCRNHPVRLAVTRKSSKTLQLEASTNGETILKIKGDSMELTRDGIVATRGRKHPETFPAPWIQ